MEALVQRYWPQFDELDRAHRDGEHETRPNTPSGYCRECSRGYRALANAIEAERRALHLPLGPQAEALRLKYSRR